MNLNWTNLLISLWGITIMLNFELTRMILKDIHSELKKLTNADN